MTEPVVNLCNNQNPPLSPEEASKRFNLFQRQMRGRLGAFCFVLLGMTMGPVPAFGLPPFFFFIAWLGLHWVSRRVFDWCTANWICIMCVSLLINVVALIMNWVGLKFFAGSDYSARDQ